jgi:glyoxylase-like metal-dependent hydrolase (beta-lactamase superfamily II)
VGVKDINFFSDTHDYAAKSTTLAASCYLIRHDNDYMLWDTGLPKAVLGAKIDPNAPLSPSLDVDIVSQLKLIGVAPEKITRIGISHNHFDHLGQAADFPQATLMIGAGDWAQLKSTPLPFGVDPSQVAPWMNASSTLDQVSGDRDVFGDGSVMMLSMPGHTPGEMALLVKLNKHPVLLSGDVVHFESQLSRHGVPSINWNRADTVSSIDRLTKMSKSLKATIIVQHDPKHIAKLPAFPASAK